LQGHSKKRGENIRKTGGIEVGSGKVPQNGVLPHSSYQKKMEECASYQILGKSIKGKKSALTYSQDHHDSTRIAGWQNI